MSSVPAPKPIAPTPAWIVRLWEAPWLWMALVVVLFCVPLFVGLDRTDFENDESIYSFAVDVMLQDGEWLTPKSSPDEHVAFLEKPPLKFWLVAAPVYLGWLPSNEFGYRFVDVLMASVAFLYVLAIGRALGGPVTGFVAVLLLFTHQQLLFSHGIRSNNMESAMLLSYCGGIYHFLAWRSVNPDAKRHLYAMSLWFVFGFMTKFVAVAFLPVILVLAALLTRADRVRAYRDWRTAVAAGLLAVALIAPWFVYQYTREGRFLYDEMFAGHVVKRFTAYLDPDHLQPWNYYFQEIWAELGSAGTRTIVVLGALLLTIKTLRHRWTPGAAVFLWFVVPLAVISSTTSKLYHYAYPFLPPLALAGGLLAALAARLLFPALRVPFEWFERARLQLWGRWLAARNVQITATAVGLVASCVALVTFAFDRIRIPLGSVIIRNSQVARPVYLGLAALILAAPAIVVRAVATAAILAIALPLGAYHKSALRTEAFRTPYLDLRACLTKVVDAEVARGASRPGVWNEKVPSHEPFYYLRGLGPWQWRGVPSDATVAMHLLAPMKYRPVILSPQRYAEIRARFQTDRQRLLDRVAVISGVDTITLGTNLDDGIVGITEWFYATLLLPGPYVDCGRERTRLGSR